MFTVFLQELLSHAGKLPCSASFFYPDSHLTEFSKYKIEYIQSFKKSAKLLIHSTLRNLPAFFSTATLNMHEQMPRKNFE
jgi:hypothetical protein